MLPELGRLGSEAITMIDRKERAEVCDLGSVVGILLPKMGCSGAEFELWSITTVKEKPSIFGVLSWPGVGRARGPSVAYLP